MRQIERSSWITGYREVTIQSTLGHAFGEGDDFYS